MAGASQCSDEPVVTTDAVASDQISFVVTPDVNRQSRVIFNGRYFGLPYEAVKELKKRHHAYPKLVAAIHQIRDFESMPYQDYKQKYGHTSGAPIEDLLRELGELE